MRITQSHIENLVEWINHEKGYQLTSYEMEDGRWTAQVANIHAYRSSGYWNVVQIVNTGGGERTLTRGTAREVYEFLHGMQVAIRLDSMVGRYTQEVAA